MDSTASYDVQIRAGHVLAFAVRELPPELMDTGFSLRSASAARIA
jgi:hypothetical protein